MTGFFSENYLLFVVTSKHFNRLFNQFTLIKMPAKHISEQEIANNRAKLAERFGNTVRRHF